MPDYSLVPVDYQPDFSDYSLVPVDYDPVSADGATQPTQSQPESQPQPLANGAGQPNVGMPADNAQSASGISGSGQPHDPSTAPISPAGTLVPANQQQPGDISPPRPASGGDGSSFGKSLLQGAINAVPGAYHSGLAQQQFRQGNYGAATLYGVEALVDAALGAATLGASTRLGAAARATSGGLAERAKEIHNLLDQVAQKMRTTAVLETNAGRIIASGTRDLTPLQRAALGRGEMWAKAPRVHAEVTALDKADRIAATPSELAVTRTICPKCAAVIESLGGRLTSRTTAVFPRR